MTDEAKVLTMRTAALALASLPLAIRPANAAALLRHEDAATSAANILFYRTNQTTEERRCLD
jgi:hypothetical protein